MLADPQSTLYIVLAVAVALLTIFLCVTLIYLILILRDVNKMLEKIRETVERVNTFILKPVSLASSIVDHVRPLIESALERREEAHHRKKKS
ncbi:MAG: hypothetical protein AAB588_03845 [Patescibacteria group bacterium]